VGKTLARFFGSLFILGAAVGAGTIGVAVVSAAPAGAVTLITVNDASDPASPLPAINCAPGSETDCTLRAALAEATVLNTVTINLPDPKTVPNNPGPYYSVDGNVGELDITDTGGIVTIVGEGGYSVVEIRAINNTRVLELGSGSMGGISADISGVTISNGNAPSGEGSDCGGICVSSAGSKLTLTDSVVSGNTAGTYGGGIGLYHGGSATLTDDTISGNAVDTAANADGGGGGIYVVNDDTSTSNLTIQNTTISGNQVDAGSGKGSGGGIDVFNTSGSDPNLTIHIGDSTISGNEINGAAGATGAGAGIDATDGNWLVTNSTISGNTETGAQIDGGGAFISNAPLSSTWSNDTVSGNQAYSGAGLAFSGGIVNATFDTIAGNTATSANTGGNLDVQSGSTLNLGESIVAGGVAGGSPENCSVSGGSLHSLAYNLIDDTSCGTPATGDIIGQSPQLGGLAANGGPTLTQLPASTSPAISAVPASVTSGTDVTADQRGDSRGQGVSGSSTIGSVEVAQAPPVPTPTPTPTPTPHGYWLVGSDGGIFTFGSSQFYGSTGNLKLQRPVVGISPTSDRNGYWMVASDGGVFAYGDAGFVGSIPGVGLHPAGSGLPHSLNAPIVGMVPSHDGGGYFMVASDGGVFAFGDAFFAGSCPGIGGCSGSAVAVMPDASGNGYWIVTNTGNVYGFGDAAYYGSPGHGTVTSAVATPNGKGYWILLSDGEVFAYGSAANLGSPPAAGFNAFDPANAIFATSDGAGYWVSSAAGAVYPFGDAPNDGSMAGTRLNAPIIAGNGY
jgi:hypothetical protein